MILAAGDPATIAGQAGVFGIVLVVAFWLLKRSDDREVTASAAAHKELAEVRDELATIRRELVQCHRERNVDRARMARLEARLETPRNGGQQ